MATTVEPMLQGDGRLSRTDAYRDVTFALLFVLHLVGVLAIAIVNGTRVAALSSPPSAPASPSKPAISLATASAETMTTLAVASTSSAVLALIWLAIIQTGARVIIFLGASAGTMLALGNAVWLLANGGAAGITLGLLSLAFCVVCIATILLNKRTLDFSALLVSTVALVLRAFPATLLVAAIGAILGVLWLLLWSSALASTLQLSNQGASIALLVLSFFWTLQTIKAVVHTTIAGPLPLRRGLQTAEGVRAMATASHWAVRRCCIFWTTARGYCFLRTPCPMEKTHAGTIGSWYFLSPNVPPRPTACSLRRACTTSFGSLCLGALLASTLQAIRSMAYMMSKRLPCPRVVRSAGLCLLGFVDVLFRFCNEYAYTQVALHGKSFTCASRDTWTLLVHHSGVEVLMQREIVQSALSLGCAVGGLCCASFAGLWGRTTSGSGSALWWQAQVAGFAIGYASLSIVSSAVNAGVAALGECAIIHIPHEATERNRLPSAVDFIREPPRYVCYAEDPSPLSTIAPSLYVTFISQSHSIPSHELADQHRTRTFVGAIMERFSLRACNEAPYHNDAPYRCTEDGVSSPMVSMASKPTRSDTQCYGSGNTEPLAPATQDL